MKRARVLRGVRLLGASCIALACASCRHIDGAKAAHDPNEPSSYDERAHDTSGPGVDQPPPRGYYGSQYGNPAEWIPPPTGAPGAGVAPGPPSGMVGANPGWGYGGNVAGGGTPAAGNYPSDRP
jgi:hypothetical protein